MFLQSEHRNLVYAFLFPAIVWVNISLEPMAGFEPATYSFTYTSISHSYAYMRVRLYLELKLEFPLSVVRAKLCRHGLGLVKAFNRYSGFTRESLLSWAGDMYVPPWSCSTN